MSVTIALPIRTLVWTPDGPRPVETLQAGDTLTGFDPATFARVPVTLERVQVKQLRHEDVRHLSAGGRTLTFRKGQSFPVFDLKGAWRARPLESALSERDWLAVDRLIPAPAHPVALPDLDDDLTARLGENALALADALYDRAAYDAEMEKRTLRLALYEISGFFCAGWNGVGEPMDLAFNDVETWHYYEELAQRVFGCDLWAEGMHARLHRWLGEGLSHFFIRALPAWVYTLPDPSVSAFLRGFFDNNGEVTLEAVTLFYFSVPLLSGIQALLGRLHIESTIAPVEGRGFIDGTLTIRNVRRFAEWVGSNNVGAAATLKSVYRREPRYPSESSARLPLNVIAPALERIRARYALPRTTPERAREQEATQVETLRLLATAYQDEELRALVNGLLYLEPARCYKAARTALNGFDSLFILSLPSPYALIANGIAVGGAPSRG